MAEEQKFPSEIIDLPSEGKLYPKEHPCSNGKIEIKYMTAKEEDILTSQNLIKKGVVIDRLLDSLILTKGIKSNDNFNFFKIFHCSSTSIVSSGIIILFFIISASDVILKNLWGGVYVKKPTLLL